MSLYCGECLEVMENLCKEGVKVDAVITDPPYEVLNKKCAWDKMIDIPRMWECLYALRKDKTTPILLFSQEPYTSHLILSNKDFKYKWYWEKTQATGFLNAKKQPMRCIEEVCVFYEKQCLYNAQKTEGHAPTHNRVKRASVANKTVVYGNNTKDIAGGGNTDRYPRQLLTCKSDKQISCLHPTQKPLALMEYLVRTYTNEGDTVLDFTAGSMTTIVACVNTSRKFIGIEKDEKYFNIGKERVLRAQQEKE